MSEIFRLKRERFPAFSLLRLNINFEVQVFVLERSPLAKAAAGLPVAVATPPEGSNPFPLRHAFTHHRDWALSLSRLLICPFLRAAKLWEKN
jgi:hypothetical protein